MESATIQDPPGFSDLSKAEQIRYLQALWDRITEKPGEIDGGGAGRANDETEPIPSRVG